eukprot:7953371-Alexandrium_andersonii.AAC.1
MARIDLLAALHLPEDVVAHRPHVSAVIPGPVHSQVTLLAQEAGEDRLGHAPPLPALDRVTLPGGRRCSTGPSGC